MYILGVSGSPVDGSNTDSIIKEILRSSGAEEQEFLKLSDMNVGPCRAHMKCVQNNRCDIDDDWTFVSRKLLRADAVVLGSPTYYSAPSSFMKCFIERCYSLRHQKLLLKGKLAAVVAVGCATEQAVVDWMVKTLTAEGMEVVGNMAVKGTITCLSCGKGASCPYPIWNTYSKEMTGVEYGIKEAYTKYLDILPDNVPYEKGSAKILSGHRVALTEPSVLKSAQTLGKRIGSLHRERSSGLVRI
ncbi:MAG: flavodoxin family protein [Methanomassiliicoccales archaeon]|nr:MAG: flavodoxin family protein [Methanomassiliicoccales archaeon]